jgi:hypothetical protein
VSAYRSEDLCDAFREGRFRHVERVRSLVQIMDNDWAGFEGPKALYRIRFLFVLAASANASIQGPRGEGNSM